MVESVTDKGTFNLKVANCVASAILLLQSEIAAGMEPFLMMELFAETLSNPGFATIPTRIREKHNGKQTRTYRSNTGHD